MSRDRDDWTAGRSASDLELRINPIACDAHGMCMELLPELVRSDPWGYPLVRPGPVPLQLLALARRAVTDCPTLALALTERPAGQPQPAEGRVRRDR